VHTNAQDGFPSGWTIAGYVLLAGSALLVGRIIYEETILTWVHGPQMVGFAMAHGALPLIVGAGLVGLLGGSIWLIASLVLLFRRQFHVPLTDWVPIVLLCALAAMLFIPYETWQELTVRIAGPGNYGNEFLIQAAAHGRRRMVAYSLRKGCDINYEDSGGTTPLSAAAVGGNKEMVMFLISSGADVNRKNLLTGGSPLMAASDMGQLEAVKALLEKGADPCATNNEGHTAAWLATTYNHDDIAEYLSNRFHCQE
jgi:hypothetical protein